MHSFFFSPTKGSGTGNCTAIHVCVPAETKTDFINTFYSVRVLSLCTRSKLTVQVCMPSVWVAKEYWYCFRDRDHTTPDVNLMDPNISKDHNEQNMRLFTY